MPFIAGCKRFDLAYNRRAINWRIAQPVAVALGQHEMFGGAKLAFINDPMSHQAGAGKKGDHLSNAPHVVRAAADAHARAIGYRYPHAGTAHHRMNDGAAISCNGAQSRQIVDPWRPRRARYEGVRGQCRRFFAHYGVID
jgi:hypothetical protein